MTAPAPGQGFPAPAPARRTTAILSLLGFFLSMDATLTAVLIEPMRRDMALSDLQIGLLQGTAFGLAFGLGSIPLGRLIDRRARVRLLRAGLAVWIAAMVCSGLAANFAFLILARIAMGLVAALLIPAALSLIADLYPPAKRSVATSMFVVGQAGGQAIGILAGGLAFDALTRAVLAHRLNLVGLAPWRALYLATASLGLVPLGLLLTAAEPLRQEQAERASTFNAALRELWSYRAFLAPFLAAMVFVQITMQAASVWATPVLIRNYHQTPGQFAGWLSAVMLGGGMLGALAGGRLGAFASRRGGRAGVLAPALVAALAIAPLCAFAVAPNVAMFATLLALNIFAGAVVATLGVAAITLNIPNEIRGLALGANTLAATVFGTATTPAAIALLSGALGGGAKLGLAIAYIGAPSAVIAAACFGAAMRAGPPRPVAIA